MNILKFFKSSKNKEAKKKKFTFSVTEIVSVGDKYSYEVKGENKSDAFRKLVDYFYGSKTDIEDRIEQHHYHVSIPMNSRFTIKGMPRWFGRMISAKGTKKDQELLDDYMRKNNIKPRQI